MNTLSRRSVAHAIAGLWVSKDTNRKALVKQIAGYLVENGSTKQVDLLVNDIKAALEDRYGIVVAEVETAYELKESLKTVINEFIAETTDAKKVVLEEEIDPSLLGGLIIRTPKMELDVSLRTKLNRLKTARS